MLEVAGPAAALIGHFFGGAVALELARTAEPEAVDRLVLYEPGVRVAGLVPGQQIERLDELAAHGDGEQVLELAIEHLHLDGCLSFGPVRALRPSTSLTEFRRDYVAPVKCADLVDFLARSTRLVALLQSEAALRLMCEDLFAPLAADHVIYAELRFAPLLHTADGLTPEAVVRVVEEAVLTSIAATGVQARIILCALRHYDRDESLLTAQLARAAVERGLVAGLDLAGDEAGFGLDAHEAAFAFAGEHGLQLTAHAGEARGADSVSETLDRLAPDRIGHGVRSIEDPAVVERLTTSGVHLEVCPTSNLQTMGRPRAVLRRASHRHAAPSRRARVDQHRHAHHLRRHAGPRIRTPAGGVRLDCQRASRVQPRSAGRELRAARPQSGAPAAARPSAR